MKVLIICRAKSPLIDAIARAIIARGDRIVIALSETPAFNDMTYYKIGNRLDTIIHRTLGYLSDTHMLHSARTTAALFDMIISYDPDIIHIFDITKDYINLPLTAHLLNRYGIPTLINIDNAENFYNNPALFKRNRHNKALLHSIFDAWETLHIVILSRKDCEDSILGNHPCYTISHTELETAADKYVDLYDSIK